MGRLYDAYVEVGPRFSGFGDIKKQGDAAGKAYGKAMADAAAKAAAADVRKLGEALAKARSSEADAAGKVRVAEAKLNEVRANGKSTVSQIAAAEESLASANRKSAAASDSAKEAAEALGKAQKRVADLAESGGKDAGGRFSRAFKTGLSKIGGDREGKQFATRFGVGMNGAIGGIVSRSAGLFVAGFAAVQGVQLFSGFIKDAAESERVSRLTAAAIKSTGGAAKLSADQVGDLATAISNKTGADDETIQSGENLLLTFTNIRNEVGKGNDIFNQASSAVTDMAAALNGGEVTTQGVKAASIQLGKALNDPIKGVTALSKVGVSFTEDQKKQIKTLVDSGKTMEAQKIILGELNKEFGGAAQAAGDPMTRLKTIAGNLSEEIGGYLLPIAGKFADFVSDRLIPGVSGLVSILAKGDVTSGFTKAFGISEDSGFVSFLLGVHDAAASAFGFFKTEVVPILKDFGGFLIGTVVPAVAGLAKRLVAELGPTVKDVFGFFKSDVIPRLKDFAAFLGGKVLPPIQKFADKVLLSKDFLVPFAGTILAVVGALKAWAVIQGVLDALLAANPLGLLVIGLAAVVGGLVYAFKHSQKFHDIVVKVFTAVKDTAVGAFNGVKAAINGVVTAFTATKNAIGTAVDAVGTAFGAVKDAVGTALDAVKSAFSAGVQFIGSVWSKIVDVVMGPVNVVIAAVKAVWPYISPILSLPFYIAKKAIDTAWAGIKAGFDAIAKFATSVFSVAWAVIKTVLVQPLVDGWHGIVKIWGYITTGFTVAKDWVVGKFSAAWSAVKNVLSGPVSLAKSAIDTVWGKIKGAFTAVKGWVVGAFSKTWSGLKAILTKPINDAKAAISTVLGAGKTGIQSVFSKAVSGISTAWNKLQELAKIPIRFIINTVLNNGLIAGFNWIAGKFGAPKIPNIPLPKGFAQGGKIPGQPSDTDNTWGTLGGKAIPLATGEFIVNARQTAKNLPLLRRINAGDGFADGGLLDKLKGAATSAYGAGKNFVGDVADFTKDAAGWLRKKFSGPLDRLKELGDSAFAKIVTAVPRKVGDTIVGKAKDVFKDFFGGGVSVGGPNTPPGNVQNFRGVKLNQRTIAMLLSAEQILKRQFHIPQGSYSTRVAASGSTHAGGGAMDTNDAGAGWPQAQSVLRSVGFAAWWRKPSQGPWGNHIHSIARGDPTASAAAKNQVADYIRGGDGLGGRVNGGRIGVYDRGGRWPSGTIGVNTSGKTETVIPGDGTVRLHPADLRALANLLSRIAVVAQVDSRSFDAGFSRHALNGGY